MRVCSCGSGLPKCATYDAAGIFLTFVCDTCEEEKMKRYNPRIFDENSLYSITGAEEDIGLEDE